MKVQGRIFYLKVYSQPNWLRVSDFIPNHRLKCTGILCNLSTPILGHDTTRGFLRNSDKFKVWRPLSFTLTTSWWPFIPTMPRAYMCLWYAFLVGFPLHNGVFSWLHFPSAPSPSGVNLYPTRIKTMTFSYLGQVWFSNQPWKHSYYDFCLSTLHMISPTTMNISLTFYVHSFSILLVESSKIHPKHLFFSHGFFPPNSTLSSSAQDLYSYTCTTWPFLCSLLYSPSTCTLSFSPLILEYSQFLSMLMGFSKIPHGCTILTPINLCWNTSSTTNHAFM